MLKKLRPSKIIITFTPLTFHLANNLILDSSNSLNRPKLKKKMSKKVFFQE